MEKNKINENIESIDLDDEYATTIPNRNEESICWFKTALYNFRTASILIENKVFAHAVFFMQQCVECLIKGILVENKIVSLQELKKWSHKPEKAIEAFFEKLLSPSIDNIKYIRGKLDVDKNIEEKFKVALDIINKCSAQTTENMATNLSKMYVYTNECVNLCLFTLAVLLNSSQQNTRYPGINKRVPMQLYDESSLICKTVPELMKCIKYIICNVIGEDFDAQFK